MFTENTTYENPYLSVEKKFKDVLGETEAKFQDNDDADQEEGVEKQTFATFVKEQPQLK
jgi:hypothetical protein